MRFFLFLLFFNVFGVLSNAQTPSKSDFQTPPEAAKPRVWWHWMNGNVTKAGITQDLEWMRRVGIGGFQQFDASLGTPALVEKPVKYRSPEWQDMLRHAASEASRLGLEMTMHSSGGWSETGGPWVKPEEAMKKIVWSETTVQGGKSIHLVLPMPPNTEGVFQDAAKPVGFMPEPDSGVRFYKDFSTVAYRIPEGETPMADFSPTVTSSGGEADVKSLTDGSYAKALKINVEKGSTTAWVQYEFEKSFTAGAFTLGANLTPGFFKKFPFGQLLASDDGKNWRLLTAFPGSFHKPVPANTYNFKETRARFWRVELKPLETGVFDLAMADVFPVKWQPQASYQVTEFELHSTARVHRWQEKAGYGLAYEYNTLSTLDQAEALKTGAVVDLSANMRPDGSLDWEAPAGQWKILRLGFSMTGAKNGPAPLEATGYEVDKLSKKHLETYFHQYFDPIIETLGDLHGKKGLQAILFDSWEANLANVTDDILAEFKSRQGYDATPYLPVLTGRVVGSADLSDRFLWDYRTTLSGMLTDYHYAFASEYLHKFGLKIYGEAAGAAFPVLNDGLRNKGRVDIPMAEFWTTDPDQHRPQHVSDIVEAASASHIYGKGLVAAESFTAADARVFGPPAYLKYLADHFMSLGVNRFVIHCSVHQPFMDKKPGLTLAVFGQHFTRHNTWAEQSSAWMSYLSRSSYLLQQGLFAADVAYFYGEDGAVSVPFWERMNPAVPEGYRCDWVNAEVILERMRVNDGRIVLPDGMSYKILVLPASLETMTLPLLKKIRDLVAAGAVVVGPKPKRSPSLAGYPGVDADIQALANELWGDANGGTITWNGYGKGRVYGNADLEQVLKDLATPPDLIYTRPNFNTKLDWIHRALPDGGHIYFVANQRFNEEQVQLRFRVKDLVPELWHSDDGSTEPVSYNIENGFTTVPLHFDPYSSVFVVFHQKATAPSLVLTPKTEKQLSEIAGNWQLAFPPNWGAPAKVNLEKLRSWTDEKNEEGMRYFSGTAAYTKNIEVKKEWLAGGRLLLDLGEVKEIAEVTLNGKPLGILWKPPFKTDITDAAKPGTNRLEIKVTNTWHNRMKGDATLPVEKRFTFATNGFGNAPGAVVDKLPESGLLGPVRLFKRK